MRENPDAENADPAVGRVATGSVFDAVVLNALPDAQIVYINAAADLIAALESGRIDGFVADELALRRISAENGRIALLEEYLDTFEFSFVTSRTDRGEAMRTEFDAWLIAMTQSGALERVIDKWAAGAAVFGMLKMGVGAVDSGQYEAAYALGHSNRHTFFRIILPQTIPHVLPAYQGEIVGLIKATAIVGYIAVQDLTKMGDIVRSRTYEAFFPLIAITVIYFVLEGLFSFAVSRIRIRIDPKKRRRDRILKGVKIDDQD